MSLHVHADQSASTISYLHTLEEAPVLRAKPLSRTPVSSELAQNLSKRDLPIMQTVRPLSFSSPVPRRRGSHFPMTSFSCLTLKNSLPTSPQHILPSSFLYLLDPQLYAFFMQINPARLSSSQFSNFLITMILYKKTQDPKCQSQHPACGAADWERTWVLKW